LISSGKLTTDPSIEYNPSTMTTIFFHALFVRGCPSATTFRKSLLKSFILLCLNTRTEAPESLTPKIIELWFSSSLITRQPYIWISFPYLFRKSSYLLCWQGPVLWLNW
jgi:hypothetical protein